MRRRGSAMAPSRPAATLDDRDGGSLLDYHRHFVTWSSLEILYWPSACDIFTRRR